MSNRVLYPLLAVVVAAAAVAGFGFASLDDRTVTDKAVAEAIAAVTPEPTPEPTPIPTPWIITEAPPECVEAIDELVRQSLNDQELILDIYHAYTEFPDENLQDFGKRVENILNTDRPPTGDEVEAMYVLIDACKAAS